MTYEQRRDEYLTHLKSCLQCVTSHTGKTKVFLSSAGNMYKQRYHTVSMLCPAATEMLCRIV